MSGTFDSVDPELRNSEGGPALLVLVAKFRDLDIEAAARLHAAAPGLAPRLLASGAPLAGSVVLSTCNRFEIYCEVPFPADAAAARAEVLAAVSLCTGLPVSRLDSLFELVQGASATEHLFAVAAGLDSVVVGEGEITGQVRRSFADAQVAGTASGLLGRLFQAAARTAKDVRAQTSLRSASRSIASVALDLAAGSGSGQRGLADVSVVLFGTGAYAACVAEILRDRKCSAISVFSHSGRADAFVAARGGTALSAAQLPSAIASADVVIGCSGTGTRIDSASLVRWRADPARPLTVIDLAPSHDFDPRVAGLPGIELITLESVHHAAPPADAGELSLARALVRQAALRFGEREASRGVDTAVVALRRHVHQVLDVEMERVTKQHGGGASADEVNVALRRLARRLLHLPAVRARELATEGRQDEYAAALGALFGLTVVPGSPAGPGSPASPVAGRSAGPDRVPCAGTEGAA